MEHVRADVDHVAGHRVLAAGCATAQPYFALDQGHTQPMVGQRDRASEARKATTNDDLVRHAIFRESP
jgi:hypothetical protein